MPKISVIVPVYNVEKYIDRCVKSILAQSFDDFELLLIDDGSEDNSGNICDVWSKKDKRIKVIHKKNGGLSSSRNKGLEVAKGEYVTFIDSDDLIHPDYLDLLYNNCKSNNLEISMAYFVRFSNDSEIQFIESNGIKFYTITSNQALMNLYNGDVLPYFNSSCGKLYQKTLFSEIRFPIGYLFEDEFTTYRLYDKVQRIAVCTETLYYYYKNESGITNNLDLIKRCDEYDAQWERIKYFMENNMKDLYHTALRWYLNFSQWDLSEIKSHPKHPRIKHFQSQFRKVLKMAQTEKCVSFKNNYDYYVIAYPNKKWYYRIKRQI